MPIDSTTVIDRLELSASLASFPAPIIAAAYVKAGRRTTNLTVPRLASGDYDPNDPEVAEVIKRVRNGLQVYYYISDRDLRNRLGNTDYLVRDDQLPESYHHLRDTHPFHANYVIPDKSRGPYVDVFYYRGTTAQALPAVSFTGLESIGAFERRVQNTGWLLEPPTGAETLWYTVVRYGRYSDGDGWTDTELARSTDINWSVDGGRTWLTEPPADYDTVSDVRVRYNSVWVDLPVFNDPDSNNPFVALSVHNEIVPLPVNGIMPIEVVGASLAQLYQIGFRMDVLTAAGEILRSGETWVSTDSGNMSSGHPFGLQIIPPDDLDEILPLVPYRYLLAQDNLTGELNLLNGDIFVSNLPATVSAVNISFGGFHVTTLAEGMGDGMDITSMLVQNATGFRIGDVVHIDDEQCRINSGNIEPLPSRVNLDRAINGTTRAAHVLGDLVRGTVRENALHYVHVWDRENTLPTRTRLSVIGLRRLD